MSGQSKDHEELAELRKQLEEERRTVAQTSSENTQLQSDIRAVRTEVWNSTIPVKLTFFVKFLSFDHTLQRVVERKFCFDLDLVRAFTEKFPHLRYYLFKATPNSDGRNEEQDPTRQEGDLSSER